MQSSNGGDKHDAAVFLDRASRATRGKRMNKLVDDEIDEDEQFWNQDALKEEENDQEYEEEGEVADVFDSDFDEDEPEPDEEGEDEPDERKRTKKRLVYTGKPSGKQKKKKKVLSKVETEPEEKRTPEASTPSEHHDAPDDAEEETQEKTIRKSTRTSVIVRQAERDAIRAALQATMKQPVKRKKEGEEKKITQEEMLLEAAQTEIMNLRNLEKVLAREEEVKKKAIVHKAVYSGPQIKYLSKDGYSYLEFNNGASFDSQISNTSTPYPQKAVCAVTGLPAKYRDPKTGLPYATLEAFKIIRERHSIENNIVKKRGADALSNEISGTGFSERKKRSKAPQNRELFSRVFARFRRMPTIEIDSD